YCLVTMPPQYRFSSPCFLCHQAQDRPQLEVVVEIDGKGIADHLVDCRRPLRLDPEHVHHVLDEYLVNGLKHVVLVLEVLVEGPAGNAGCIQQMLDGSALQPTRGKHRDCMNQDLDPCRRPSSSLTRINPKNGIYDDAHLA